MECRYIVEQNKSAFSCQRIKIMITNNFSSFFARFKDYSMNRSEVSLLLFNELGVNSMNYCFFFDNTFELFVEARTFSTYVVSLKYLELIVLRQIWRNVKYEDQNFSYKF